MVLVKEALKARVTVYKKVIKVAVKAAVDIAVNAAANAVIKASPGELGRRVN